MQPSDWLDAYRRRDRALGAIPEAQWRMLLLLDEEGPQQITSLIMGAGVPCSTGLRHVDELAIERRVMKLLDPADKRRVVVKLSNDGRYALDLALGRQPQETEQ